MLFHDDKLWGYGSILDTLPKYQSLTSVINDSKGLTVTFNLAGTKKKDISVETLENTLKVTYGDKTKETYVDFSKYDMKNSSAEYENGLLTVILPKAPPKTRKILIK